MTQYDDWKDDHEDHHGHRHDDCKDDHHHKPEVSVHGGDKVEEGGKLHFTFKLDKPQKDDLVIRYEVKDVTTEKNDYEAPSGTVYFKPYETEVKLEIKTIEDYKKEDDEVLKVVIKHDHDYDIKHGEAEGTIKNDDRKYFDYEHHYKDFFKDVKDYLDHFKDHFADGKYHHSDHVW